MTSSIIAILACVFTSIYFCENSAAFSTLSLPQPRYYAPALTTTTTTTSTTTRAIKQARYNTASSSSSSSPSAATTIAVATTLMERTLRRNQHNGGGLVVVKGIFERLRRRGKNRVRTLERDRPELKDDETEDPERQQLWRVMFHDSEYQPESVARVLAKVIPTLDRRMAYELCSHARIVGKVPVMITRKKDAELYCSAILRQGLTATIEVADNN